MIGRKIAGKPKLVEKNAEALYMLDKELTQRIFTPPAVKGE
ncbi:unnamed protein product [marine sediment metagenome]|uniref:Uncharacterized protein n=1 Tax=marine sediment metagenome TaxID=412755 RepID=X1KF97_9ZZZZ